MKGIQIFINQIIVFAKIIILAGALLFASTRDLNLCNEILIAYGVY